MYQLKCKIIGKKDGNFRFAGADQDLYIENLRLQIGLRGISKVFIPHCGLTTNVAQLGKEVQKFVTPWFIRTEPGIDGAMVTEPGTAIGILNADCPVVILFDQQRGHLVLLHAGFRCLVPKDISTPNIISTAFKNFQLDPPRLDAFIGLGAGPCCYGIDHHLSEVDKMKFWPYLCNANKGPRTGQTSFDLSNLAKTQLLTYGVKRDAISLRRQCTACTGRQNWRGSLDSGDYYSNIYEGKSTGRNLVLAWFDKT